MTKLAILNFKRKKKSWRLLISVMILAYAFMAMMLIFYSSLNRTEEAHREKIYGSWHIAMIDADEEAMEDVKNHATVETYGISRTYGMALNSRGEQIGKIGTVDKNTVLMENIKLMDGKFPAESGEIAVEMSSLSALGCTYRLGQRIQVKTQVRSEDGQEEIRREYTLVGVIQDYSAKLKGTTPDKRDYVSFFVNEDDAITSYHGLGNIVCRLHEDFLETNRELVKLRGNSGKGLANNYTYFELSEESGYQVKLRTIEYSVIIIFWVIVLSIIFSIVAFKYKTQQNENLEIMSKLGMDWRSLKALMTNEFISVNVVASILGGLLGALVGALVYLVTIVFSLSVYISINIKLIILWLLIMLILSSLLIMCIIHLKKVKKISLKSKNKKKNKLSHLSEKNKSENRKIKKAFWYLYKKDIVVSFWVTTLFLFTMYISLCNLHNNMYAYNQLRLKESVDYRVGVLYGCFPVSSNIDSETYMRLKKVYGVSEVEGMRILNYYPISWEREEKSSYAEELQNSFWPRYTSSQVTQAFILGIDGETDNYNYYVDELDDGNIDKKEFVEGDSVILYIPPFSVNQDGFFEINPEGKYNENTIKIGDYIQVKSKEEVINVKVGGIIRNFKNSDFRGNIGRPFVIIGSYKLAQRIDGNKENSYECITINTETKINIDQTEYELNKILDKKFLINNVKDLKDRGYNINVGFCFFFILALVSLSFINFIRKGERATYNKNYINRVKVLKNLGGSQKYFYLESLEYEIIVLMLEILIAFSGVLAYNFIQYLIWLQNADSLSFTEIKSFLVNFTVKFPWGGFWLINLIILMFGVVKSLKLVKKVILC